MKNYKTKGCKTNRPNQTPKVDIQMFDNTSNSLSNLRHALIGSCTNRTNSREPKSNMVATPYLS